MLLYNIVIHVSESISKRKKIVIIQKVVEIVDDHVNYKV